MDKQGIELLQRLLERMKFINGPDQNCIFHKPDICENHKLIHEVEAYLALQGTEKK